MQLGGVLLGGILLAVVTALPVLAATDKDDISVGIKTIALLENKIEGSATVAVVFNPVDAESQSEAQAIREVFDAGIAAPGGVKFNAVLVPVNDLNKIVDSRLVVITYGLKPNYDAIAVAVNKAGALSMSADLECVKNAKCILGLVSKPSVEIYYNAKAAEAAAVRFAPAFTMLMKRL